MTKQRAEVRKEKKEVIKSYKTETLVCDDDDKHTVWTESSVYDEIQCEPRHQCMVMINTVSTRTAVCDIYTVFHDKSATLQRNIP